MINRRTFLTMTGASLIATPQLLRAVGPEDVDQSQRSQAYCAHSGKKPNVILVLCDDLGWGDIGYWQNQRTNVQNKIYTPGLDAMITDGVVCTNAYTTAPVCAPARASMVTGKHQGHCNLRSNMFDRPIDATMTIGTVMKRAGYSTWHIGKWGIGGGYESGGQPRRSMACDAGFDYSYGYPGHSHGHSYYHWELVDWRTSKQQSPIIENISNEVKTSEALLARYGALSTGASTSPNFEQDTEGTYWRRLVSNDEVQFCYDTDLFTAKIKQLIKTHLEDENEKDKPFFCYACYTTVHGTGNSAGYSNVAGMDLAGGYTLHIPPSANTPEGTDGNGNAYGIELPYPELTDDTEWGGGHQWVKTNGALPFKGTGTTANKGYNAQYTNFTNYPAYQGRYATAITRLDAAMKDIRNYLRVKGLDKDTLVIFTSDNGPAAEQLGSWGPDTMDSNGPFKGMKRWIYEGGVREPSIVVWPDAIPAGGSTIRECATPFQFPAWMATLADVAGLPQPARCDGVSLLPGLTGSGRQLPMRVYSEYSDGGSNQGFGFEQMIRDGNYVLLRNLGKGNTVELYDVVNDRAQTTNLATNPTYADRVRYMTDLLVSCRLRADKVPDATGVAGYYENTPSATVNDAAMPATPCPGTTVPKWQGKLYIEGADAWPWVPNFRTMIPEAGFVAEDQAAIATALAKVAASDYGVSLRGWIEVAEEQNVTFTANGGGGCHVWLHESHIIDREAGTCTNASITLKLAKGRHPLRIYLTKTSETTLCQVSAGSERLV